uniref:Uncharacterized protein n=1 Tax=Ananas comosus var. bracteatus TaxID=296719 RepID=A0A6V7NJ44_ANACO|nr:unnamed protein product [Ananas comosus var. bracteatus]
MNGPSFRRLVDLLYCCALEGIKAQASTSPGRGPSPAPSPPASAVPARCRSHPSSLRLAAVTQAESGPNVTLLGHLHIQVYLYATIGFHVTRPNPHASLVHVFRSLVPYIRRPPARHPSHPRGPPAAACAPCGRPGLVRAEVESARLPSAVAVQRRVHRLSLGLRRRIVAAPSFSGRRLAASALEPVSSLRELIYAAAPLAASSHRPAVAPDLTYRPRPPLAGPPVVRPPATNPSSPRFRAVRAVSLSFVSLVRVPQWPTVLRKVSTAFGTLKPISERDGLPNLSLVCVHGLSTGCRRLIIEHIALIALYSSHFTNTGGLIHRKGCSFPKKWLQFTCCTCATPCKYRGDSVRVICELSVFVADLAYPRVRLTFRKTYDV